MTLTKIAAGLVLAAAATGAQAVDFNVVSMSIVEINGLSSLATANASTNAGGVFYFGAEAGDGARPTGTNTFNSTGTGAVGIIANGVGQADNQISTGFLFGGAAFDINTIPLSGPGGVTASITGSTLAIDTAAWGGVWANTGAHRFILGADTGTLVTAFQVIDATHVYYTADWSHTITSAEDFSGAYDEFGDPIYLGFTGNRADWHLEGIATVTAAVPEASTYGMMLAGLGLVGGMVARRRKMLA